MSDKKKLLLSYIFPLITAILAMGGLMGCSDDNDELQQSQYGYVQFKLYKSASYSDGVDARATDKLNLYHMNIFYLVFVIAVEITGGIAFYCILNIARRIIFKKVIK